MKRDSALVPLSREHQNVLMLIYCLKHGHSSNPKYPWPSQAEEQRKKVLYLYQHELKYHFYAEDTYIYHHYKYELSPDLKKLALKLIDQHRELKELFILLENAKVVEISAVLHDLYLLLETHTRQEEQVFFQGFQAEISPDELKKIGLKIIAYYASKAPYICIFTGTEK